MHIRKESLAMKKLLMLIPSASSDLYPSQMRCEVCKIADCSKHQGHLMLCLRMYVSEARQRFVIMTKDTFH